MAKKRPAARPVTTTPAPSAPRPQPATVNVNTPKTTIAPTPADNPIAKRPTNPAVYWGLIAVLAVLFTLSIFKNIAYPLFWADESMTVVGAQRVLQYGYPKVHNGKNVFYDMRHSDPALGIDKATDAYVGGTSWGHYYFGTIGVKLADGLTDLYAKTAVIRTTYALAGLLGIFFLGWLLTSVFTTRTQRLQAILGLLLASLVSVPLAILIREARYYPLSIFLIGLILLAYCRYRFVSPKASPVWAVVLAVALWGIFMTFAPVYFIMLATLGVAEGIWLIGAYLQSKNAGEVARQNWLIPAALLASLIGVYPLLDYFKVFTISAAMAEFNQYTPALYRDNLTTVLRYFGQFELLYLAIAVKIVMAILWRPLWQQHRAVVQTSLVLTLFFVLYVILITRIPNFIFTRYLIPAQPVLSAVLVLDGVSAWAVLSASTQSRFKLIGFGGLCLLMVGFFIARNRTLLSGHLTELGTPYKGPLDYAIPFIAQKTTRPDTLTIATNYEETSFMYYLGAKTIVGFVGNNLPADSLASPDVIMYRRAWGNFPNVFNSYLQRGQGRYKAQQFPVAELPVNNLPEVNFRPPFNHFFKTVPAGESFPAAELYYR